MFERKPLPVEQAAPRFGDAPAHLSALPSAPAPRFAGPDRCEAAQAHDMMLLASVAFGNDRGAFEELYHLHVGAVTRAAMQICRNNAVAQEIAQRTFMTLWERAARLVTKSVRLRSWLVTVARNAAIDQLRMDSARSARLEGYAPSDEAACPQDIAITNALAARLGPALASLPARQRLVIELHYFEGLTFAVIADRVGEPLNTVKSRARLGLDHLRRRLG